MRKARLSSNICIFTPFQKLLNMSDTLDNPTIERKEIFGHPTGLFILFFTEMWERFSYYGMRAILVLYMFTSASADNAGLGWTKADAIWLYGWYTMLVYVMSIPGGIVADRLLGQKKTVLLGGLILCAGHLVLAIESLWAFYLGLSLIILGVGGLKPNISTMVGGLYPKGDPRRDSGFMIFYIGINIGALLSALIVGYIGETIGWHYGFGLAGIGMLLGQAVYMLGLKHLKGVGDYVPPQKDKATNKKVPLTKVEKDRMIVLFLSFIIIIVFWGAFEQAGGLMNIYALEKVDRTIGTFEIPASVFQSVNAAFIILLGGLIAAIWNKVRKMGKESSSLFKMALGTIIMGIGFLAMTAASMEAGSEPYGKAGMYWLILAYLLHTIGELCASPVALSFITKLAPVKYASFMMGAYFAATGFGNKLAGTIGESAQIEEIKVEMVATPQQLESFGVDPEKIAEDENFSIRTNIYYADDDIVMMNQEHEKSVEPLIKVSEKSEDLIIEQLDGETSEEKQYHATLKFEKDEEAKKDEANKGDGKNYTAKIIIEEVQNAQEKKVFTFIFIFTLVFGLLLILFLKKLKKLTHGADEDSQTKEPYPDDEYSVNPDAQS